MRLDTGLGCRMRLETGGRPNPKTDHDGLFAASFHPMTAKAANMSKSFVGSGLFAHVHHTRTRSFASGRNSAGSVLSRTTRSIHAA